MSDEGRIVRALHAVGHSLSLDCPHRNQKVATTPQTARITTTPMTASRFWDFARKAPAKSGTKKQLCFHFLADEAVSPHEDTAE
jgi:hypothetical protein